MGSIFSFFMAFISSHGRPRFLDSELFRCRTIQLSGTLQAVGFLKCLERRPALGTHFAVDRSGIVALSLQSLLNLAVVFTAGHHLSHLRLLVHLSHLFPLAGGDCFSSAAQPDTARVKKSALANTVLQIPVNIDSSSLSAQRILTGQGLLSNIGQCSKEFLYEAARPTVPNFHDSLVRKLKTFNRHAHQRTEGLFKSFKTFNR